MIGGEFFEKSIYLVSILDSCSFFALFKFGKIDSNFMIEEPSSGSIS